MNKLRSMVELLWAKHYAVLIAETQDEVMWAVESLKTADNQSKHSAIVINGEVYKLASYGEKEKDGSRSATLRLANQLK